MYEKGDIIIVNNKAHKLHNKPCMIIGTGRNWLKEVCYFATPLDLKIKPRSYSFTLNETIYTNPYALLELAERLGDFEYKNHIIKKYHLKDVKRNRKKYKETILSEMRVTYKKMLDAGSTTVWEVADGADGWDGLGSLCHGWSSIPIHYYRLLEK